MSGRVPQGVRGLTCEYVPVPGGVAIACSRTRKRRCKCGRAADLLCDWKVPGKKGGTCDKPICNRCTTSPAEGKDLCPDHARAFMEWKKERETNG